MAVNDEMDPSCACAGCGKVKDACGIATNDHAHDQDDPGDASAPLFERHYWVFLGISGFMLALALVFEHVFHDLILLHLFAIGSIIFSGHDVFKASYREIISKQLGASTLMVVAAIGSLFIAHGTEGAMAIFLYSLAEKLEGISAGKARDAVSKLLQLSPDTALVKDDSGIQERPTGSVEVGDTVVVKPGAKVPLDGIITKGKSFFDTHAITGESIPRLREPGDQVHASSINGDSLVEIQVNAGKSDTLVARITESIKEAQQNKSKTEKFIDRFARYYTPVIFSVAVAVMVLLPVLGNRSIIDSVYTGFILLVISCPCALTLSSPLSMVAALTKLSREGILVKGGKFIERLKQVDTFGFDKTATITEGKLKVHDNVPIAPGWSKRENLQVIASLEVNSDHPIAKAIVEAARSLEGNGIDLEIVAGFTEIKGKGITGTINGKTYLVGSPTLFQEREITVPKDTLARYTFEGKTPVLLGSDGKLLGMLTIRDNLRVSAPILMRGLNRRNISSMIISGDAQRTVDSIADCLFIDKRHGDLLPHDKLERIRQLQENDHTVAMVGDGINDAPALSQADVGIAMGASGTDIAIESSDVTIMNDDLTKILVLLDIQEKTNRIVRENIWFSITVKIAFAILTVLGFMTLALAVGIGDMGVSLLVILNGFRVFTYRSKFQEISEKELEVTATSILCSNCKTAITYPQHHGREMVPRGDELVCWKSLVAEVASDGCKKRLNLKCPSCDAVRDLR